MGPHPLRSTAVAAALFGAAAAPLLWLASLGPGLAGLGADVLAGAAAALDAVGWVLVPQTLLAVAVLGTALQLLAYRAAGASPPPSPAWMDPAVESALLLGMLGTISGMVNGFVGVSPDGLEASALIHALGTALRSSFVGFGIALVGVWIRARVVPVEAEAQQRAARVVPLGAEARERTA
jgi:hypothetical protein